MTENLPLIMMTYFIVKHYLLDFTKLQTPFMFLNKGTYGHPGGMAHAGIQALASAPVLMWAAYPDMLMGDRTLMRWALMLPFLEFVIHYHMDWFKMWVNKLAGYKPDTHPQFWNLLGIDQLIHYLTYVGMTWVYVS